MTSGTIQKLIGIVLFLLGTIVIVGWIFRVPQMIRIQPDFVGMTFNAALCFMLTGIAFVVPASRLRRYLPVQEIIGWFLIVLSGLVLTEIVFNVDLLIDFPSFFSWLGDSRWPGRMAPNTCIGFMLAGAILVWAQRVHRRITGLAVQVATFALLMIGLTGVVGYSLKL